MVGFAFSGGPSRLRLSDPNVASLQASLSRSDEHTEVKTKYSLDPLFRSNFVTPVLSISKVELEFETISPTVA